MVTRREPIQSQPTTCSEEALSFCRAMLPEVSRTFALAITLLRGHLSDAVTAAYLLCRLVDTIEDDPRLPQETRRGLFDAFEAAMRDDRAPLGDLLARVEGTGLGLIEPERRLGLGGGQVFELFRSLPTRQRGAIRPAVLEMAAGMRAYTERAAVEGGLAIRDFSDLERYCYFVAGTVGHLLTALFELEFPALPAETRLYVRERAERFGLGLQMVNIVKDIADDLARGDCFLPRSLMARERLDVERLLAPERRDEALRVVRAVAERARGHLDAAAEYTLAWPAEEGGDVRQFCAVPLALALASLREVASSDDTLRPGATPRISRQEVITLVTEIVAARDDAALRRIFVRAEASSESKRGQGGSLVARG